MATNVLKKFGRLLETGAIFGSAAVSRNPKKALSTSTKVGKLCQTARDFYQKISVLRQLSGIYLRYINNYQ